MNLLFAYIVFCALTALALFQTKSIARRGREWQLTPELTLVASFFLYTSAMPISRFLRGAPSTDLDIRFLISNILAITGLAFGLFFGRRIFRQKQSPPITSFQPVSARRCLVLIIITPILAFGYIYYSVGMSMANILTPYAFEASVLSDYSTLDLLIFPTCIAVILYCYAGAAGLGSNGAWLRRLALVSAFILSALLIIRGMRNLTQILWLPVCAIALYRRRLPIAKAVMVGAIAFSLYSYVAVRRNVGFGDTNTVNFTLESLDPALGELGTSYNVYTIYDSLYSAEGLQYGKTYTLDFLSNLVPRALWHDRPRSTAVSFSIKYYGTDELVSGLGFSPVVEAIANFSVFGILPVFAISAFLIVMLSHYFLGKGRWGLLSFSVLLPMIVNWNRIDSSAAGKMFLIYVFFFIALDRLLRARTSTVKLATQESGFFLVVPSAATVRALTKNSVLPQAKV